MTDHPKFEDLLGQTITAIEVTEDKENIKIATKEGRVYRMYHEQSCCESVYVEDICGDLEDLIGEPLLQAEEVMYSDENPPEIKEVPECQDSWTWTFYKLATIKGSVTIRWYGASNGYYSERVDFKQIVKPETKPKALIDKDGRYLELPKVGDSISWLDSGGISKDGWAYDNWSRQLNQGNIFVTREDAEKEAKRREVMQKLRVLAGDFAPDWNDDDQEKWYLFFDCTCQGWDFANDVFMRQPCTIYFPTIDAVHRAIVTLGDELDVLL